MRVIAKKMVIYGGVRHRPGTVFDVADDTPLGSCMEKADDATPARAKPGPKPKAKPGDDVL